MARMETKMDHVATHKDLAAVRIEVAKTGARNADLRVEVLKEIGDVKTEVGGVKTEMAYVKTLIANREASMQRWLLGITATAIVGISTAMAGVAATLIRTFA